MAPAAPQAPDAPDIRDLRGGGGVEDVRDRRERAPRPDPVTSGEVRAVRQDPVDRPTVWRELGLFLGVQVGLTSLTTAVALQQGADVSRIDDATPLGQAALYLSAAWPLVAALTARRIVHGRFRWAGWGFRRAPWGVLGLAWVSTLLVVVASGVLVVATGRGGVDLAADPVTPLLGLTVVVLPYVLLALGEEIGWRGLVVTRLAQVAGPRTVVLGSGLAWSAFHWPLILWLGGAPEGVAPWFALAMFTVALTAFAAILASMQLRWGLWPVCIAHAVWNATLYQVLEPVTVDGPSTTWFATETGACLALTSVVAAVLWWRRFPLRAGETGTTIP
jgi:membrane protease YdiL (CAAX protease family)